MSTISAMIAGAAAMLAALAAVSIILGARSDRRRRMGK